MENVLSGHNHSVHRLQWLLQNQGLMRQSFIELIVFIAFVVQMICHIWNELYLYTFTTLMKDGCSKWHRNPFFWFFPHYFCYSTLWICFTAFSLINSHKCTQLFTFSSSLYILVTLRHQSVPSLIDGLWSRNLSFSLLYFLKNTQGKSEQIKTILRWFEPSTIFPFECHVT